MASRKNWTEEETTVALGFYFQMPFSKINYHNPEIKQVAELLGRTPSALAMKLVNLARLDPSLSAKDISGLSNGSKLDTEIWAKYADNLDLLSEVYDSILQKLKLKHGGFVPFEPEKEYVEIPPGLEKEHIAKYRVNQTFFRQAVLSAYGNTCCVTGINDPRLLVASHIKPWAKCSSGTERTTPSNGLCLSALYDKAFDRGLMTFDEDCRVVLSKSLKEVLTHASYEEFFLKYKGTKIAAPAHHAPLKVFLEFHRENVFVA